MIFNFSGHFCSSNRLVLGRGSDGHSLWGDRLRSNLQPELEPRTLSCLQSHWTRAQLLAKVLKSCFAVEVFFAFMCRKCSLMCCTNVKKN